MSERAGGIIFAEGNASRAGLIPQPIEAAHSFLPQSWNAEPAARFAPIEQVQTLRRLSTESLLHRGCAQAQPTAPLPRDAARLTVWLAQVAPDPLCAGPAAAASIERAWTLRLLLVEILLPS